MKWNAGRIWKVGFVVGFKEESVLKLSAAGDGKTGVMAGCFKTLYGHCIPCTSGDSKMGGVVFALKVGMVVVIVVGVKEGECK